MRPSYPQGAIQWFTSDSTYKLCDGANWNTINLDTVSQGACSRIHGRKYDPTLKAFKVCDPTSNYKKINCVVGTGDTVDGQAYCTPSTQVELTAPDGAASDQFGISVSFSSDGSTALIGAPNKTVGSNGYQGAAYVFTRNSLGVWELQQELSASDGAGNDHFGDSVSLSSDGNTALVGAYFHAVGINTYQGAAYVFTRSGITWTQQQELTAADGGGEDHFGTSVSLSGDGNTALVGDYDKLGLPNSYQGAAYVFTRSGSAWSQQAELTASDAATNDYFGWSVSLSSDGNTALIGARGKTVGGTGNQGVAYIFTYSGGTWTQAAELTASDGAANDYFGNSVSLSSAGSTALIGAYFKTFGTNSNQGAAYIFDISNPSTPVQKAELTASDGAASDAFGTVSLSSDGNTALIGAYNKNSSQGAAYLFTNSGGTWTQSQEFAASDGAGGDEFGYDLALSGDAATAIIASPYRTAIGYSGQGAAYVIPLNPTEVTSSDGASSDDFGNSVSLSSDGNTALIGAPGHTVGTNSGQGTAYVFTKKNRVWTQAATLTALNGTANEYFGQSVSLSADGNTALIGANGKNSGLGAAYIFTRSGSTWSQAAELSASDGAAGDQFGYSVSLSSDGNTALIGTWGKLIGSNSYQGAAYVFTNSGGTWSQAQELTSSDGAASDYFGSSVAISGTIALIGALNKGAAYVFTYNGSTWSQQQELTASGGAVGDEFGRAVALSSDGSTALIGADYETVGSNSQQGAAYIFTNSGGTWTQSTELTATDGAASDRLGFSVALSSNGNTALIGAYYKNLGSNSYQGAAYMFTNSGGTWSQAAEPTALDGAPSNYFGYSASLSSDGSTALIGADGKNSAQGAAYFYDFPPLQNCTPESATLDGTGTEKTTTTPWTALSSVTLASGDALLVCISSYDTVTGVTWNGTAMTQDASAGTPGSTGAVYIYSLPNATAGTADVVVTLSGASSKGKALTAMSFSGLATSPMLDQTAAATGSSTAASSGATATTTASNELLFGCVSDNGPSTDTAGTWNAPLKSGVQRVGSSGQGSSSNMTATSAYGVVSATGAYTASYTLSSSTAWQAAIATYKIKTIGTTTCQPYGRCPRAGEMDYYAGNGMRWCDGTDWLQMKAP